MAALTSLQGGVLALGTDEGDAPEGDRRVLVRCPPRALRAETLWVAPQRGRPCFRGKRGGQLPSLRL